ncbi:MAG: hypothetical protein V3U76_13840 [Granulosicoccus sp.]
MQLVNKVKNGLAKSLAAGVFLAGLVTASAVFASPSVSGQTISWPDDGWYQVQSATTYESLCEGGTSCEVAPGTYHVINLTTGQRYERRWNWW